MKASGRVVVAVLLFMMVGSTLIAAAPAEPNKAWESWDLFAPTMVQAPDGTIWAAWVANTGTDREIVTSRGDGNSWEPVEIAVANPGRWDATPNLAIDANGIPWLAWSSSTGIDDSLHLSHWTGRGWSTPQEVPAWDTIPNRQPVLAPAADGGLWLAWVGFDGNDDEIYVARWDGTRWSEPQQVSGDDTDPAAYDTQPRLGVGSDGSVWVAWAGYEDFLDDEVFAAHWDGQRWSAAQQVSTDDDTVNGNPSLAVADDGTAWLAWDGRLGRTMGEQRIHVSRRTRSAGWDEETIISSPPESGIAEEHPSLALDSQGLPLVLWHLNGGSLGLGYAAFDGSNWSSPRWAVQDAVTDAAILVDGDSPLLLGMPETLADASPLKSWMPDKAAPSLPSIESRDRSLSAPLIVTNRHLAFGDSITWGQYVDPATDELVGDYPARLEVMLDSRVVSSEVINDGVPGESTRYGRWRITDTSFPTYQPQFIEIMEGTNDITNHKAYDAVASNLSSMVYWTKRAGSLPMLATLIPRRDDKNDETAKMNEYIAQVAASRGVPLVDNWQSFYDYPGDWRTLFIDHIHPNTEGMAVLAESWYDGILANVPWLVEDTTPPLTWIDSVGDECGEALVEWDGSDDTSWVVDFDVQSNLESGGWSDWLVQTEEHSAYYRDGSDGDTVGFRVRGRDVVGNPSEYGDSSPVYTTLHDTLAPEVEMYTLPPAMKAPLNIRWMGEDKCGPVTGFDVQYSVGSPTNWQPWLTDTISTSGVFDPPSSQYGQTHYFHVRARDLVGHVSGWSDPVSTYVAEYVLSGQVYTVRDLPVMKAEMDTAPTVPVVMDRMGSYEAYLPGSGDYELAASHGGFGTLPPMHRTGVSADKDGLDLYLPPLDDAVSDGGFEAGTWGDWQPGGATLTSQSHTGDGAALLGATSTLSQSLSVPGSLTNATLSFLVRLENGTSGDGTLEVRVDGTPISHTQVVSTTDWTHTWLPVDAAVGQPVALVFTADNAAVRLDEVSVGTARHGGGVAFFPIVHRSQNP